jgi:hypothetical protein
MPAVILDSISLITSDGRPLFDGLTLTLGRKRTSRGQAEIARLVVIDGF